MKENSGMKKKTLTIKLLIPLFMVLVCVYGNAADNNKGSFNIQGVLWDATPDFSREKLARFEETTEESFEKDLISIFGGHPISGKTVRIQGRNFVKETKTDSKGKFKFMDVPGGLYKISCEFKSELTGETVIIEKNIVSFSRDEYVELSNDLITIKGRIVDQRGTPIAKAKISADIDCSDYTDVGEPPTRPFPKYFTCSDSQGDFELVGITPTGLYALALYLGGLAYEGALPKLKITVQSPGFAVKEISVFLVTDTLMEYAKILLNSINKGMIKHGKEKMELRTDKVPFPKNEGNTIYVDQIVLDGDP
jgi:hypothetical protein